MGFFSNLLSGGIVGSIERIASEAIQTDMESAEARSLLVKVLDPNGKMRRDLSRFASRAYGFYLATMTILIFMHFFGIGDKEVIDAVTGLATTVSSPSSKEAMDAMTSLFMPITASWAGIVSASFGVQGVNAVKGR